MSNGSPNRIFALGHGLLINPDHVVTVQCYFDQPIARVTTVLGDEIEVNLGATEVSLDPTLSDAWGGVFLNERIALRALNRDHTDNLRRGMGVMDMPSIDRRPANADEVIDEMKQALVLKTDGDLAKHLGISKSNISSWRARSSIPYEYAIRVSLETGISLDDLLLASFNTEDGVA